MRTGLAIWLACGLLLGTELHAEQLFSVDDALQQIFPGAAATEREQVCLSSEQLAHIEKAADISFKEGHSLRVTRLTVTKDGRAIGYAIEDVVSGRWGPIRYLMGVDSEGAVAGVVVLEYQEIRGRPIAKRRFLKQYLGKTAADRLRIRKDIDGVTGATVSSSALTDGIRKNLHILKELAGNKARAECG